MIVEKTTLKNAIESFVTSFTCVHKALAFTPLK